MREQKEKCMMCTYMSLTTIKWFTNKVQGGIVFTYVNITLPSNASDVSQKKEREKKEKEETDEGSIGNKGK